MRSDAFVMLHVLQTYKTGTNEYTNCDVHSVHFSEVPSFPFTGRTSRQNSAIGRQQGSCHFQCVGCVYEQACCVRTAMQHAGVVMLL